MGEVYRADDLKLGHTVALKFLPKELADDEHRLDYFHSEVRLTRQVSHPNICRVYDIGEVDGQHYLSMEFVDGEDLKLLLRRIGRLPPDKGLQIAQQLCTGLAAAHDKSVLHRDLKPANIMIDGRGQVRITDFGLAQIEGESRLGEIAGTPTYMAPEQLARGETTVRSDLYSLGLILYEVFTGEAVHKPGSFAELIEQHSHSSASKPSLLIDDMDPAVEQAILRCLEKQPQDRPRSALVVAGALPGGDPLAAALAAGETPSPEMIAAAGDTGQLSLQTGGALMAGICILLAMIPFLGDWADPFELQQLRENEPAVLRKIATDLIATLGHSTSPTDSASGLSRSTDNQLEYWYRQSTASLSPNLPHLWQYSMDWKVSRSNPPLTDAGMTMVVLRPSGKLIRFEAILDEKADSRSDRKPTEWNRFFAAVGLDQDDFAQSPQTDTATQVRPSFYVDDVTVWRQNSSTSHPTQIVMATRNNRLVYFDRRSLQTESVNPVEQITGARERGLSIFVIVMVAFAGVLAMRNLAMDRTDTKGALRCALYYFSIDVLLWLFIDLHRPDTSSELVLAANYLIRSLAIAFRLWLYYVALEPFVRRLWPTVLISWSRIISGQFGNSLVGRELLIGALFGITWTVISFLTGEYVITARAEAISSGSAALPQVLVHHQVALLAGIVVLAFLLLMRVIFRNTWLTAAAFTICFTLLLRSGFDSPAIWGAHLINAATIAALYLRFGLVAAMTGSFTQAILTTIPHTADFSEWYADPCKWALGTVFIVAVWGFYTSTLAGRVLTPTDIERSPN